MSDHHLAGMGQAGRAARSTKGGGGGGGGGEHRDGKRGQSDMSQVGGKDVMEEGLPESPQRNLFWCAECNDRGRHWRVEGSEMNLADTSMRVLVKGGGYGGGGGALRAVAHV